MHRILRIQARLDEMIGPAGRVVLKPDRGRRAATQIGVVDERHIPETHFPRDVRQILRQFRGRV